jgi:hypothetical protein
MDFDMLYPARFLKAVEFGGKDWTLRIARVELEDLGEGSDKKPKAVVSFSNAKKQWVMNRTNGSALKAMFGRDTNDWLGKRVTLYPAEVTDPFTGELILAIRVRGSPDIQAPLEATAKIGRKNVTLKLARTVVAKAGAKAAPPPPPPPVEAPEEDEGPPGDDAATADATPF